MQARFHDGRTAQAHDVELTLVDGAVLFYADGQAHRWALAGVEVEVLGGLVRLAAPAGGDGRLMVDGAAWRAATGGVAPSGKRFREARLIGALVAAAAAVTAFVFIGMPALSGPLARATPIKFEQQMGDSFDVQISAPLRTCKQDPAGQAALRRLGETLQRQADTPFRIRVRAVEAPFANAFALPGGAVLVTDDLIAMARSPEELSAVIAHEAAHVEKRHVMQAVWRSFGFGMVLDAVVGGGSGAGQQAVLLAGGLSDLRYGRQAEAEADARGQDLLQAAGLSSQGMAPFFARLAGKGGDAPGAAELIASHPASRQRAEVARARAKPGAAAFTPTEWAAVKAACVTPSKRPARR
ncbi:M48 family metallopeptidase [Phenylobacterium sp.]|uniref:M48 family metallopeptidase n=1 Tax=Phenylobacterium sp. TaxID=1871053 RepID=UPI002732772E|nr:M48 family metallopeptidase [Phenylobacterium sp.]MDP3660393.1 M48 family metallopeptidase [Phenylobacterium sp.]